MLFPGASRPFPSGIGGGFGGKTATDVVAARGEEREIYQRIFSTPAAVLILIGSIFILGRYALGRYRGIHGASLRHVNAILVTFICSKHKSLFFKRRLIQDTNRLL